MITITFIVALVTLFIISVLMNWDNMYGVIARSFVNVLFHPIKFVRFVKSNTSNLAQVRAEARDLMHKE